VESSRGAVNLGGILILWDRLFGTHAPAHAVRHYGLSGTEPPASLLSVYSSPLVEAIHGRTLRAAPTTARDSAAGHPVSGG
jgi:hypothetical protein